MHFKKVAITGHTKGIGNILHSYFLEQNIEILGFSLDNDYDISTSFHRKNIINQIADCDLFLNHAYSANAQLELAKIWHITHYNKPHYIVNTGTTFTKQTISEKFSWLQDYTNHKKDLNSYHNLINQSSSKCRSILVELGYVNTDFMDIDLITGKTVDQNNLSSDQLAMLNQRLNFIDKFTAAEHIIYTLNQIQSKSFISQIVIENILAK